jgi:hypothetical protein
MSRLYTLKGDSVNCFDAMEIPCDSGYVLVACGAKYKCADYETAFKKAMNPAPSCS